MISDDNERRAAKAVENIVSNIINVHAESYKDPSFFG